MNATVQAAPTATSPFPDQEDRRPLNVHFVPRWSTNPYHDQLAKHLVAEQVNVHATSDLKSICKDTNASGARPDVLHIHALPLFGFHPLALCRYALFWLRLLRLQKKGTKLVWTIHNIAHHEASYPQIDRFFSRRLYFRADSLIVHTSAALDTVETLWRVRPRKNVFVIPHGNFIDCYPPAVPSSEARSALDVADDKLLVLFLGNIRPYKGVLPLIAAFRKIADSNAQLVIAGDVLSENLEHQIRHASRKDTSIVFRPGFVSNDDVSLYMSAADVVVFPYTKALTSGALVLAMSYGRACIAPKMGALGDTLDAEGGFLYYPNHPHGLSDALLTACERRRSLAPMGVHNRRKAEAWGWDKVAQKTAEAYRSAFALSL